MPTFPAVRPSALLAILLACAGLPARAATVPDTLAQRLAACISCHAREEKRDAYFPRIAGKPAGYLYNQLLNFRAGRRNYPLMTYMVAHQSDAYLAEMADYFSRLAPSYPPLAGQSASATQAQLARGQTLVEQGDAERKIPACTACHGATLGGVQPAIPGLLGLPGDYINAQFGAWRNHTRHAAAPDCMAGIAERLSVTDVAAISQWLSRQPVPADVHPAARPARPLPLACGSMADSAQRP
ncbi:c-type cytochrome [Duganella qianjiadongensis]|uniref:C-type cytochrome n=1 Tax=Duganella qianjiadongensis TaxID=2692176 RepID=A0ABW9VFC9_9BURK|nr:c-type cytochrome [Duganella qianjiadongensis]MYM38163.1 c-type cytochrome [Duganella qianjiadongensis]